MNSHCLRHDSRASAAFFSGRQLSQRMAASRCSSGRSRHLYLRSSVLGWEASTPLLAGIALTYQDFLTSTHAGVSR